ncbi:fimbrial protein [Pragia fontium]|uniref:fimbrial protein n=1 Tax=Pragia fontium TaxID=82985 RepID=UPI00064A2922|nr:type 1 fimbrial protein [Pragia fontium]AKJ42312.1 hypothetical protein QQ39_09630 [Pragia fontium]SUB82594.1 Uncharacterised protein [Pragia fontium]VEJ55494.1 Uncharacterised protein [Pragia fontium]
MFLHEKIIFLLFFGLFSPLGLGATNSVNVTFEASFYSRTCKVSVSEPEIIYGYVQANNIVKNDAGVTNTLNRDIILTLSECTGTGNLGNSSTVVVSGNSTTINGKKLFKDSGSSSGVGIKLISDGLAKTAGDSVWTLTSSSTENDQHTVTAALSCGGCQNTTGIGAGDFKASITFTVVTN